MWQEYLTPEERRYLDSYQVIRGSDVIRDGMFLELCPRSIREKLLMEAFYSDVDGSMTYQSFAGDVPEEVVVWFKQLANKLLPRDEPSGETKDRNQHAPS
jgi:hypothetical protein